MNQIHTPLSPHLVGEEVTFDILGLKLHGKAWGDPQGEPVLALHGWLDNANTFDLLAPTLPELYLIALDFAGHGASNHRAPGVHYQSLLDIQDVLAVADALGWQRFALIGHSMGANIASEITALFPERVSKAVMVDGFMATGGLSLAEQIDQNREAVLKMLGQVVTQPRVFDDVAAMAQRVTEATDQSLDAASMLVARGHKVVDGGVTWRTDPRIRFPTPSRMSTQQVNTLVSRADVASLLLVAQQGDEWYRGEVDERSEHHPQLTVKELPGPHHIHLEPEYVAPVIEEVRAFFNLD